ncbi:alpha/beta hydrolase family protein [Nonomuraea jiangxiensis]|uniref:Peptidase S9 prolyl oligopeptidase catalytic domain-containing protein n=1 Tax=Nonomuraea jiangxiensis TaxID=633440 RepID=A0A1G9B4T9_9ACTN|nr:prolyl oligopeptidase family serine peptidase [Nonomuraea jiangxiensis]SDK34567.1 hypothetical protein SAMN05421869_115157 [Nonomuraea jiangxiensis]
MLPSRKSPWLGRWIAALLIVLSPLVIPAAPAAAADDLVGTEVTFHNGAVPLHGTVLAPAAGGARRPGLVLIAGAGGVSRESYRAEAEAFARSGVVVLIYDKRSGYSRATSSFADLADDAIAGVRLLRARADVQPSRVGVWGHSEGGWVAPLAAVRSPDVAFVITAGAGALPSDRTQLWSNRTYLSHAGVTRSLLEPIGVNLSRMMVAAGLFGDTGHDPVATLRQVRQPLLAVFAEHDRSTVPGESVRLFRQALDEGGNRHYTLRVVPAADHDLRHSTDGFVPVRPSGFAPGYLELVTSWIAALAGGAPRASADAPPAQELASAPLRPPAWYETGGLQIATVAVMLIAFLGYPAAGLFRRRGRTRPATGRWAGRVLAAGGLVCVLGTVTYLFSIVATGATTAGSTVLGRPLVWLLLQVLAVTVVAAGVRLALRLRQAGGGVRRGLLLAGGLVFVPWAAYWGLFTP